MDKKLEKAMSAERMISSAFAERFMKGGIFSGLIDAVKADGEMAICFRGKDKYCNIYYRANNVLRIVDKTGNNEFELIFDFNHARYTKEWESIRKNLIKDFLIEIDVKPKKMKGYQNYQEKTATAKLKLRYDEQKEINWKGLLAIYKGLINDFTDGNKNIDYFKTPNKTVKNKNTHIEKNDQQRILMANFNNPGFFIYDMEYSQHRPYKDYVDSESHDMNGRFDMLGIRQDGDKQTLILIEVKSTVKACKDEENPNKKGSGVNKHRYDLERYLKSDLLIDVRKKDAVKIIGLYNELFGKKVIIREIAAAEYLFIFCGAAKKWYDANSEKLNLPQKAVKLIADTSVNDDLML